MKVINPLQLNDLNINGFLKIILAIQLGVWGVIGLDAMGLQIPILRQLIGFVYLTFIPGIVILRILKLHKLGNIETLLYTVGLSIATLMSTGLLMNMVYPIFGISGPISIVPLIFTISAIILILCILSYVRDKDFSDPSHIDVKDILSPPALFLCLLPFLAIFGTYLVNFYHNNVLLMLLIAIIALIVVLVAFDKFIPKKLYPLAIFTIALALLFHSSLISMYLIGWDTHCEYYFSNLVKIDSCWNPIISSNVNAMLSITMLAPIISNMCGMSLTWVFKIIYPLLFSLMPLGLYHVFQKQTNEKIAFLSCFFFMSVFTFYTLIPALARQGIAELFLVLLIMLMIDKDMNKIKNAFLFIVFGISLVISHYGVSYIYMFCLIAAWLILFLTDNSAVQKSRDKFYSEFSSYKRGKLVGNPISRKIADRRTISSTFVLLFIVFTLTWYMYVSSSSAFGTIVYRGDHIANSIFTEFLNPEAAQGLDILMAETKSPVHTVHKYLHIVTQFFIAVGILTLLAKRKEIKFKNEYSAFSVINFVLCLVTIAVPYFAAAMQTARLYHVTLIFLSPLCVIGGIAVFKMLAKAVRASWTDQHVRSSLKVLSVFFAIFLLFNTGFVDEIIDPARTPSVPLAIANYGQKDITMRGALAHEVTQEQDVFSAKWLSEHRNINIRLYTDYFSAEEVLMSYGMIFYRRHFSNVKVMSSKTKMYTYLPAYIYLSNLNVIDNRMTNAYWIESSRLYYNTTEISPLLERSNKVYTNGGSEIYYYE